MSRVHLALAGYVRVESALAADPSAATADQAEAWLRDEVCPVVEQLLHSRSFRLAARWSLDQFSPGARTPGRLALQAVDRALVDCARVLAAETEAALEPAELAVVELIAARPWFDLVCPEEYFHAHRGLALDPGHSNQEHEDAFQRQQELRIPLGDYLVRSLLARVAYWQSRLQPIWQIVFDGRSRGADSYAVQSELFSARVRLDQAAEQLVHHCRAAAETRSREAAVALTQVYAAYAAAPHLEWLGFPTNWAQVEGALVRSCIRRRGQVQVAQPRGAGGLEIIATKTEMLCDPDVLRQIAAALHAVLPLYEAPEDPAALIEWATGLARLVMVDRFPRVLAWEGREVSAEQWDESDNEWNLLWRLAYLARAVVTQSQLAHPDSHPIKSRRSRLKRLVAAAPELDALIETVRGEGYRLQLAPDDIILLEDDGYGGLRFAPGRRRAI